MFCKEIKMKKQELEQENAVLKRTLAQANQSNSELFQEVNNLKIFLNNSHNRISFLEEELRRRVAQDQATKQFNDSEKYY